MVKRQIERRKKEMRFKTYSEKDLPRKIIDKGVYDVEVIEAIDQVSKNDKEMIRLTIAVWSGDRVVNRIYDYLLDEMPAKLRHACDAFGLLAKYETGSLRAFDFEGRVGKAKIGIEVDKNGVYPDKNKIDDYVCREAKHLADQNNAPPADSDLPF
jgi:methylmalonyl-CoA mutase N-terminal domain/subunit